MAAAGMLVKMITGDHAGTAAAIARKIGLDGACDADGIGIVLNGEAIARLSDAELSETAERVAVFARVAPEQKLRLVEALQANGRVVAMTGYGVNDAPALRQANIVVAMGISGTEVAKEAADMVLTDDSFSSIEAAIEEGRACTITSSNSSPGHCARTSARGWSSWSRSSLASLCRFFHCRFSGSI